MSSNNEVVLEKRIMTDTTEIKSKFESVILKIKLLGLVDNIPISACNDLLDLFGLKNVSCIDSCNKIKDDCCLCYHESNIPKCIYVGKYGCVILRVSATTMKLLFSSRHSHCKSVIFRVTKSSLCVACIEENPVIYFTNTPATFTTDLWRVSIRSNLSIQTKALSVNSMRGYS